MNVKLIRYINFIILLFLGIQFICTSCGKGEDELVVQNFDLPAFDSLILDAVFDVEIVEDEHFSLRITGTAEVIKDLTYTVQNDKLTITNSNSKLWTHPKTNPPILRISGKGLTRIEAKETCNIKTLNTITTTSFGILLGGKLNIADLMLDCTNFYYWNTSPVGGRLTLKGKTDNLAIYNGALMEVDAIEFPCDVATVYNGSKSDVHVFVRNRLDYSISGTGNIYLSGHPGEILAGALYSTGRLIQ
jgi:Putative auto-transporter adhesin, head GIN domain